MKYYYYYYVYAYDIGNARCVQLEHMMLSQHL